MYRYGFFPRKFLDWFIENKKKCLFCKRRDEKPLHIHHIDTNHENNNINNLMLVCNFHHKLIHAHINHYYKKQSKSRVLINCA